tara:strand:- start:602 stop:1000 length:399 start_codon:yes stop_codon:yes gene_type:complete
MNSVFSKLINGELPCNKVAETGEFLAFLDINPNTLGHTLCIPKKQEDKIFDLSESEYIRLLSFTRKVALALRKSVKCERIGMSVIGLEVSHVHIHLIPINSLDDITFQKKTEINSRMMTKTANEIFSNFNVQ